MCEFIINGNKCKIDNSICVFMIPCSKINGFKPTSTALTGCRKAEVARIPNGYSLVTMERKGILYIDTGEKTIQIKNPFNYIPKYVKVYKNKNNIRLKEWRE